MREKIHLPVCVDKVLFFNESSNYAVLKCSLNKDSEYYNEKSLPTEWTVDGSIIESRPIKSGVVKQSSFDFINKDDLPPELGPSINIKSYQYSDVANKIGQSLVFIGKIDTHPKYGKQFSSGHHFLDEIKGALGLKNYLKSLPYIGAVRSKKIIDKLGAENVLDVLTNNIEMLSSLRVGISQNYLDAIREQVKKDAYLRELFLWLGEHNIGFHFAERIIKKWGEDSVAVLTENPYLLTSLRGIGFLIADKIAIGMFDGKVDHRQRAVACLIYILTENLFSKGHLCMPANELNRAAGELLINETYPLESARTIYKPIFKSLFEEKNGDFFTYNTGTDRYVYLKSVFEEEKASCEFFNKLATSHPEKNKSEFGDLVTEQHLKDAEKELQEYYKNDKLSLNETQIEAVKSAFTNSLTVITGGGGTGKSTICRAICTISKAIGKSVMQMAPTGKAAKVLTEKTSLSARTIHRVLGLLPGKRQARYPIMEDIVTIDEFSMCGLDTIFPMAEILPKVPRRYNFNMVIVGDPQQLPSVSAGNFLFDIIKSGLANVIKLEKIYRQDEKSYIPDIANKIAHGIVPDIPTDATDFKWVDIDSPKYALEGIESLVKYFIKKEVSVFDFQIICPMYKGELGIDNINEKVQDLVAKESMDVVKSISYEMKKFYVGDKVMQQENNYEKEVFNGECGRIIELGNRVHPDTDSGDTHVGMYIIVDYGMDGDEQKVITYWNEEIKEIRLSWCCSVHKFQGSQCKNIAFIMDRGHSVMMNRELVYTAITRAEKYVYVFGNREMLRVAAQKSNTSVRYTNFMFHVEEARKRESKCCDERAPEVTV